MKRLVFALILLSACSDATCRQMNEMPEERCARLCEAQGTRMQSNEYGCGPVKCICVEKPK